MRACGPLAAIGIAMAAALASPWARADFRGFVYEVSNPAAPRAEWRRQPLAGAYVAITWSVTIPAPGHPIISCRHGEIARTDESGRFVMDGPGIVTSGLAHLSVMTYAPGRQRIGFPLAGSARSEQDITMARSALPPEERIGRLLTLSTPGCPGSDQKLHDPQGLLPAYHESLLAEARTLQVDTSFGRNVLAGLEAAVRRHHAVAPGPIRVVPAPSEPGSRRQANPQPAAPAVR